MRDPQARGIVTHDALDILREADGSLGINIKCQLHPGAADAIQLAQDRLGDIADLRSCYLVNANPLGLAEGQRERAVITSFHQFSPVCGVLLKLMLCRRNTTSTGVLLMI
jgi:hypothetical protein